LPETLTSSDTTSQDRCSWHYLRTRRRRPRRTDCCQRPEQSPHRLRRRLPPLLHSVRRRRRRRRHRHRQPRRPLQQCSPRHRPRHRPLRHRHSRCRRRRLRRHAAPSHCCPGTCRTARRPSSFPRPLPRTCRRPEVASRTVVLPGVRFAATDAFHRCRRRNRALEEHHPAGHYRPADESLGTEVEPRACRSPEV